MSVKQKKGRIDLTCKHRYPIRGSKDAFVVGQYGFACGVPQCHELRGDLFDAFNHRLGGGDCASKEALSSDRCTETHVGRCNEVDELQIGEDGGYS